jgi:serine/threonine-protein kinase
VDVLALKPKSKPGDESAPAVRYKLVNKIAEGGMAELFLARQIGFEGFEKLVVIKRILPHLSSDAEFVRMFLNEARILARLTHPNVVQVFELGRMEEQYFIAMEFVHGEDLRTIRDRIAENQEEVTLGFCCRIAADILSGLAYAHGQRDPAGKPLGLVHRDVSPANVLVTYEGSVKLVDFGIAKSSLLVTQAGQFKGKFAYMSPEQVQLTPVDGRADVFATGILLWELVAGVPLFKRGSVEETVQAVLAAPVPLLHKRDPRVPPRLDAIVQRALARSLAVRYPTAEAMREDLEALMREERWDADALSLRKKMRQLFADKIAQQEADLSSAGKANVIDFLLAAEEGSEIRWIGRKLEEVTPSSPWSSGDHVVTETGKAQVGRRPLSDAATLPISTPRDQLLPFSDTASRSTPAARTELLAALPPHDPNVDSRPTIPNPPREARWEATATVPARPDRRNETTLPRRSSDGRPLNGWPRRLLVGGAAAAALLVFLLLLLVLRAPAEPPPAVPPVAKKLEPVVEPPPPAPDPTPAPANATVRVRTDARATFTMDRERVVVGTSASFEISPGEPHHLDVRPAGRDAPQSVALPVLQPGQTLELELSVAAPPKAPANRRRHPRR